MRSLIPCLLLALLAAAISADDTVLQVLVGSESDGPFQEILYLATGVELNRAGLTTRRSHSSVPGATSLFDRAAVATEADRTGSDFVLVVDYHVGADELAVEFSLYTVRVREGDLLATTSLVSPIDIDLDARVSHAVRGLIQEAGVAREQTALTFIEGIQLEVPGGQGSGGFVAPGVQPVGYVDGPELAVGVSGLVVVGAASEYFSHGLAGAVSGGYAPSLRRVGLCVGARAGVVQLRRETGVVGGELYVLTVGPEAVIGTPTRSPTRLGVRVAGGGAVVMIVRPDETIAKTDLYVQAGVGARLPLGELFSVGIDMDYFVVFEPEFPIMGLVPSLTVSMEP